MGTDCTECCVDGRHRILASGSWQCCDCGAVVVHGSWYSIIHNWLNWRGIETVIQRHR